MKDGIKAIIFDYNGVLSLAKYSTHPKRGHRVLGLHEYVAKKLKISIDQWFDAIDTNYALSIEGKVTKNKLLSSISKNLEVDNKKLEKILFKAHYKYFKTNKKLFKQAFKLKKLGYKIAILSDQWPISKEALMIKKYTDKFHKIVISCNVGMRKPNIKIYRLMLKKLKLKGEECIFIDNQKWNMPPAKKLKIKTIVFKDNKQLFKDKKWKELFE